MPMETFVLGCGGMMPLPNRHLTSILIRREGELFLFDCGESTQISLKRLNLKWKRISAIFISHTHADHVTGLPGILMLSAQVERDEPLIIIGPPRIADYIRSSREVLEMYLNYKIEVREIEDPSKPGVVFEGDGYKVYSFPLYHSRVCVGYKFVEDPRPGVFFPEKAIDLEVPRGPLWSHLQNGEAVTLENGTIIESSQVMGKHRPGRKVSYVTDTSYNETISQEVKNSDLLICEAMFGHDLADSAAEKKHLTAKQAGKIASDAGGIERMGMIHFSPRYTDRELEQLKKECQEEFPKAELCKDRMFFEIPNKE